MTQNTIRRVANTTFGHLHSMDLSFHLSRQTGSLGRIIDRGTRGSVLPPPHMQVQARPALAYHAQTCPRTCAVAVSWTGPARCPRGASAAIQRHTQASRVLHSTRAGAGAWAGINFILSSMVFNVVPTAVEVSLVAGILAWKCGPALAGLTAATLAAYVAFTFAVTQVPIPSLIPFSLSLRAGMAYSFGPSLPFICAAEHNSASQAKHLNA